jgi:O-antigen/teichoic acid export membrane protein
MFYLLLPVILLNTVSQSFWWVGDAFQKNEYHSLLWAGSNLSKFVFVSLFLLAYGTFLSVVVGFLAGEIVSLYVAFSVVRKRLVPVRFRYSGTVARDLLQKAWPIGLGAVLSILFFRVDVILLEYLTTEAVVGWFSASAKILEACAVIPSTVTIVLFPVFSSNSHLPWSRFAVPAMKSLVTMGGIGTATALVFFVTAPQLIPFVYGPDFGESVSVLRVLAWAIIFIFMNMICSYLLVSYRYAGTNTLFHAGAVVFKIGLSLWLIPAYRHLGAAYSTLIAEGVLFLLYSGFFAAMRYVPERPFAVPAIKPVELGENEQIQV